jgi:hypothetical protein
LLLDEPTNSELDHGKNIDEIKVEQQQQLITVDFMFSSFLDLNYYLLLRQVIHMAVSTKSYKQTEQVEVENVSTEKMIEKIQSSTVLLALDILMLNTD